MSQPVGEKQPTYFDRWLEPLPSRGLVMRDSCRRRRHQITTKRETEVERYRDRRTSILATRHVPREGWEEDTFRSLFGVIGWTSFPDDFWNLPVGGLCYCHGKKKTKNKEDIADPPNSPTKGCCWRRRSTISRQRGANYGTGYDGTSRSAFLLECVQWSRCVRWRHHDTKILWLNATPSTKKEGCCASK